MGAFFATFEGFPNARKQAKLILQMDMADVLKVTYLQQNAYTDYDAFCPLYKSIGQLLCTIQVNELSKAALERNKTGKPLEWNRLKDAIEDEWDRMRLLHQLDPNELDEEAFNKEFAAYSADLAAKFSSLPY